MLAMDPNAYAHQLNALKTRVRQQASALAESEALAIENMQYVAELEQQVTTLQQQTEQFQQKLEESETGQGDLEQLKTELATCQSSHQVQLEAVDRLEAELTEALEVCTQFEEELTAAQKCCEQLEAASSEQAQELQGRITALEGDRDRLARQSLETVEAKEILANQLSDSRRNVETLTGELDTLKEEIEPLRQQAQELAALKEEVEPLKRQLEEAIER